MFRIITEDWDQTLAPLRGERNQKLTLVCPFIKAVTINRIIKALEPRELRVITRFNLSECLEGVNDLRAMRIVLERTKGSVKGIKDLHSKIYVIGKRRVVAASANLTESAFFANHEFGFESDEASVLNSTNEYVNKLWDLGGKCLDLDTLATWEESVNAAMRLPNSKRSRIFLPDFGTEIKRERFRSTQPSDAVRCFVKLSGTGSNRLRKDTPVIEELKRSGSHLACSYPVDRRPRSVADGDIIYFGRLVKEPDDIIVYGRAEALAHDETRDVASQDDIAQRPWKETWPNLVRVRSPQFVDGTLNNGVSLNQLMETLSEDSFASTQKNKSRGIGNTNPRHAYRQQPAIELSKLGASWLKQRLESKFAEHGILPEVKWLHLP